METYRLITYNRFLEYWISQIRKFKNPHLHCRHGFEFGFKWQVLLSWVSCVFVFTTVRRANPLDRQNLVIGKICRKTTFSYFLVLT